MIGTTARTNRDGHRCPDWCAADHDTELIPGQFLAPHSSEIVHVHGQSACAVLTPSGRRAPEVQVCTSGGDGGSFFFGARQAGYLARLIEDLADATPAEHRELAAAIRQAAAVITGDGNG